MSASAKLSSFESDLFGVSRIGRSTGKRRIDGRVGVCDGPLALLLLMVNVVTASSSSDVFAAVAAGVLMRLSPSFFSADERPLHLRRAPGGGTLR